MHNNKYDEYCNKVEALTNHVWVKVDPFGPVLYQGRTHAETRSEQRRASVRYCSWITVHGSWLVVSGPWILNHGYLLFQSCRSCIMRHGSFIADLGASSWNLRLWTLDPGCRIYGHGTRVVVHRLCVLVRRVGYLVLVPISRILDQTSKLLGPLRMTH